MVLYKESKVIVNCDRCGKKFNRSLSHIYRSKKHYCSRVCFGLRQIIDGDGYVCIYMPEHPHCNGTGYIRKQRLIMEKNIGRYLLPEENVHHLDGNKLYNEIENLIIMTNSQHISLHARNRERTPNGTFL